MIRLTLRYLQRYPLPGQSCSDPLKPRLRGRGSSAPTIARALAIGGLVFWSQHINSLQLRPGVRLSIRMGYGSDANELPLVFNGVVTEVPVEEGEIQVVALSDGVELMNDMPHNDQIGNLLTYQKTSWFGGGMNPREMVMEFLDPAKNWWNATKKAIQDTAGRTIHQFMYYDGANRNPYGIEHFGKPVYVTGSHYDGEAGVNLYNPEYSEPLNESWVWDQCLRFLQLHKWHNNDKLLGVNVQEANPSKIFKICQKSTLDYIVYPAPIELRSTLFFGKPWFPFYYEYRDGDLPQTPTDDDMFRNPELYFQWKPFQQIHVVSSTWNLIGNQVRADASEMFTRCQAVGTFNGFMPWRDYSPEASHVWMIDEDIYDQFQKTKVVESGLYTTGAMKADDALADLSQLKLGRVFMSRGVVNNYAQMELLEGVQKMYAGPFVLLGNGYIKPYDLLCVNDELSGMNGNAISREVVHTMSVETGFVTQVTPGCLATCTDFDGRDLYIWLQAITPHLTSVLAFSWAIGALNRKLQARVLFGALDRVKGHLQTQIRTGKGAAAPALQRQKLQELETKMRQFAQNPRNVAAQEKFMTELLEDADWKKVLGQMSNSVRGELLLNRDLRRLVNGTAQVVNQTTCQVKDLVNDQYVSMLKDAAQARRDAHAALRTARRDWDALSAAEQNTFSKLKAQLDAGRKEITLLTAAEQRLVTIGNQFADAQQAVAKAAHTIQNLRQIRGMGTQARSFMRGIASKAVKANLVSFASMLMCGSLSEMLLRWSHTRQCLILFPLKIRDKEFTAGINGHRGAVYGDPLGPLDKFLQWWGDWLRDRPEVSFGLSFVPVLIELTNVLQQIDYEDTPQLWASLPRPATSTRSGASWCVRRGRKGALG